MSVHDLFAYLHIGGPWFIYIYTYCLMWRTFLQSAQNLTPEKSQEGCKWSTIYAVTTIKHAQLDFCDVLITELHFIFIFYFSKWGLPIIIIMYIYHVLISILLQIHLLTLTRSVFLSPQTWFIYIYMKIDDLLRKTCRIWREKESEYEDLLGIMQ